MKEHRKSTTIMFTVIDGYTALVSEDKQKAHSLLEKSRDIIKPLVKEFNGEWHKDTLSSFSGSVDAVNCALEIQTKLKDLIEVEAYRKEMGSVCKKAFGEYNEQSKNILKQSLEKIIE